MKITEIEIIRVEVPYLERVREHLRQGWRRREDPTVRTCIYKVHTDEGLVGYGEGTEDLGGRAQVYVGRDPFEFLLDDRAGPLQIALYDLMGKFLDQPVYRLFGPKQRDEVFTAYWSHCYAPEILAQEAKLASENGFTLHKIKARPFRDIVAQVAAMSEVAPEGYRIAVDANGTFGTAADALRAARKLEEYPQVWALETPIPQEQIEGYRFLKSKLDYPIAIHSNYPPQMTAIRNGMCDYFVLEFEWAGNVMKQAAIAEAAEGMGLWVENGLFSGLSATFQTQYSAAIPNVLMCITLAFLMEDDLVIEPLIVKEGYMKVPQRPGLGVDLDEDAVDRYRVG